MKHMSGVSVTSETKSQVQVSPIERHYEPLLQLSNFDRLLYHYFSLYNTYAAQYLSSYSYESLSETLFPVSISWHSLREI